VTEEPDETKHETWAEEHLLLRRHDGGGMVVVVDSGEDMSDVDAVKLDAWLRVHGGDVKEFEASDGVSGRVLNNVQ